jgi:hypothetical protein
MKIFNILHKMDFVPVFLTVDNLMECDPLKHNTRFFYMTRRFSFMRINFGFPEVCLGGGGGGGGGSATMPHKAIKHNIQQPPSQHQNYDIVRAWDYGE